MSDENQRKLRNLSIKLQVLAKQFKSKAYVTAGIQKGTGKHEDSDLTVASIAAANEFGVPQKGIPERSFMRSTMNEHTGDYKALVKVLMKQVLLGKITYLKMMELVGQQFEGDIKKRIQDTYSPPNAPETIRRKKSDHPLIDKSQMLNSIRYKVENGDK